MPGRTARVLIGLLAVAVLALIAGPAAAHEERPSQFPPGDGSVPTYRPHNSDAPRLVVCKDDSSQRIADIRDRRLRAFNRRLLHECEYEHIQQAVDAVTERGSNIYLLPGLYLEEPTRGDPPCAADYEGGAISYEFEIECPDLVNLVTIIGDDPDDEDIVCDNQLCDLQIEGTGDDRSDVLIEGGFRPDGEWVKHNAIKADRADGIYFRNFEITLFRENGIYVHETDGYVIDDVLSHNNDLYGFLSFASDHGLFVNCEAHHNGDSGIYPGSPADVNAGNEETGPLDRWAAEIDNCDSHHNALGFSGTAGNSVYIHDSDFHHNGIGMVTDSFLPNHPGMPQDHDWLVDNRFFSNNENYYVEFVQKGLCAADVPPAERGYETGTVCPTFLAPVGTGLLYAGGNYNFTENNEFYDNWRYGAMLIYIPAAIREEYDPVRQFDVSNFNHFVDNRMGFAPGGLQQPNGLDFWWDDQGDGNCWQDNTSVLGEITHNALDPRGLPDCDSGGSQFIKVNPIKTSQITPCAMYDREREPEPEGCEWDESPPEPPGRQAPGEPAPSGSPGVGPTGGGTGTTSTTGSTGSGGTTGAPTPTPTTGGGVVIALLGLGLVGASIGLRRHRAVSVA